MSNNAPHSHKPGCAQCADAPGKYSVDKEFLRDLHIARRRQLMRWIGMVVDDLVFLRDSPSTATSVIFQSLFQSLCLEMEPTDLWIDTLAHLLGKIRTHQADPALIATDPVPQVVCVVDDKQALRPAAGILFGSDDTETTVEALLATAIFVPAMAAEERVMAIINNQVFHLCSHPPERKRQGDDALDEDDDDFDRKLSQWMRRHAS